MLPNTHYRSNETEAMDDFNLHGDELAVALDKIAKINQLLGGNQLTKDGIWKMIRNRDNKQVLEIVDLGCGNGDMLRTLSVWAKKKQLRFNLRGVDANAFTVGYAASLSENHEDIQYTCADILDVNFRLEPADIILFTLTLHHFTDKQILQLLKMAADEARIGIVVNDLQRSRLSYVLFGWVGKLFHLGKMNIEDGKLSILRGFRKKDLESYAIKLNHKKHSIRWKWAFRYQWIISSL
ncbi:MAG TPA: methyltransferase domain-containing protein [Arachidicoccus sp.]|nr:methyltransferase domain-containing protein [Arachidicoccus sp.]